MTQRERQILRWIEENPMISQQELADKAGITRSSASVHISNLMKKGYIAGKGYVLRSGTYVVVVGGVNMDIGGCSDAALIPRDSNPGQVRMSVGGVGRNIAHNISLLGMDARMLSAIGDDINGEKIAASCTAAGLDFSRVRTVRGGATSTYLFITGPEGDMELAVSDMEICKQISPEYLERNLNLMNSAQLVVVDTNLPQETLQFIAEHVTQPIFADPVSVTKAEKLRPILGKLHTLKPNLIEAELLSGVKITSKEDLERAADVLLSTGLHRVFISLGGNGVFAADHREKLILPCIKAQMRNATGAGDAFVAGLVWAYLQGSDLKTSTLAGSAAAAIAIEGIHTINEDLSEKNLITRMNMEE
ncbi:MAG: PfkB family carbohydrate kinase [Oscillospiraceae bacterium]|nr:PfkB family carbohydrate kinase [Oscillospiraceae bacterium]